MKNLFKYLKFTFFGLLFIQVLPTLFQGIKSSYGQYTSLNTKVGRIAINGLITDSTSYAKTVKQFFKDNSIKAIVLKIESPGGVPGSCQALYDEILALKKRYPKPIIAFSENICASGGYYIASATDHIITTRAVLLGSIGATFNTMFNLKKLAEKYNIGVDVISSGAYKAIGNRFKEATEQDHAYLQQIADNQYNQFVTDVAKARKLTRKEHKQWADGKIFTGQEALTLKLIDQTGSYSDMVKKLKELAPIEGSIQWIDPADERPVLEKLLQKKPGSFASSLKNSIQEALFGPDLGI